ncbi:MAG: AMP-binding protein [Chloroflexota bacterium]
MVVGDIIKSNARIFPDKLAITDDIHSWTWRQFSDRVNRLANALLGLGLTKGERVAILAENCSEYVEFLFAIASAGLIGVCLNYRLTTAQIIRILKECEPRAMLVQSGYLNMVEPIRNSVASIEAVIGLGAKHGLALDYEATLARHDTHEPDVSVNEEDPFLIQYTTGTTGTSKGAVLTHKNEIANCMMRIQATATSREDVVLNTGPLFATGHQARVFGNCFLSCTQVITAFSPRTWVEMIEKYRVTYSSLLAGTTFKMVKEFLETSERKYDLSSLRKLQPDGGQHVSGQQLKEMLDFFKIPYSNSSCKPYGMTEAMPGPYLVPEDIAAGLSPDASEKQRRRLGSVGKPLLNSEMRIVDENDRDIPPGQVGEILLRGDQVIKGYWKNPELTARAFRGGWFHTSDLGMVDEDGYLYFQGRKDFVIKTGGLLVGPEEVENVLLQHPAVAGAAVFGVPDDKWGQAVMAAVCLKAGATATDEELRNHCRKHLAGYQVPKSIVFTPSLPRDAAYGKVDRHALVQKYGSIGQGH